MAVKKDHLEGLEGILDEAEEEVEHMRYWSLVQFNLLSQFDLNSSPNSIYLFSLSVLQR